MTYISFKTLSDHEYAALVSLLRQISNLDDGAFSQDRKGFNKDDTDRGNELAEAAAVRTLSSDEVAELKEMLFKYWRQLPEDPFDIVYGTGAWQRVSEKCGGQAFRSPNVRSFKPSSKYSTRKYGRVRLAEENDVEYDMDMDFDPDPGVDWPYDDDIPF